MSSSLLLHQRPPCLARLVRVILEMGCRWSYSGCFVGCRFKYLLKIVPSILAQFSSSFFPIRLVSVHVMHPIVELTRPLLGGSLKLVD